MFFALLAWCIVPSSYAAGLVSTREFSSATLGRDWSYVVYLPADYYSSDARYPVLYLLHGNGQKGYDWVTSGHIVETADALTEAGKIPKTIIVMPDAGTTWFVDRKEKMETAFLQDLIPEVERSYRTVTTRDGRFVAGLSMGGYGAMRFSLKYPERFAAAALLSPAIYSPEPPEDSSARRVGVFGAPNYDSQVWKSLNYPALWDDYLRKGIAVPMYINSGDDDQFYIEADATAFYSLLRRNKQPAELRIVNGGHTWAVWSTTIGDALTYIFSTTRKIP
jgi:enterochelin esterase-like enzyme